MRHVQLTLAVLLTLNCLPHPTFAQVPEASNALKSPGFDGQPLDPNQPVIMKIISPASSEVLLTNTADVFLEVDNYTLAQGGNRIRVILDNNAPVEIDDIHRPAIFRNLDEGGHTVRALAVRPDGVSLANRESMAMVYFFVKNRDIVQNFINPGLPFLTVSSPLSGQIQPDPLGRVWLDFRVTNGTVGAGGTHTIRYTCNNVQGLIDKPLFFPGIRPGHYEITAELLTIDQQPVPGNMNKVTRVFDVVPAVATPATPTGEMAPSQTPKTGNLPPAKRPESNTKSDFQD